jgi:hypothetical protein
MNEREHSTSSSPPPQQQQLDYASPAPLRSTAGPSPLAGVMWITGNLWILAAVALYVIARKPGNNWYVIMDSRWITAFEFWLIVGSVASAGLAMLVFAIRGSRRG